MPAHLLSANFGTKYNGDNDRHGPAVTAVELPTVSTAYNGEGYTSIAQALTPPTEATDDAASSAAIVDFLTLPFPSSPPILDRRALLCDLAVAAPAAAPVTRDNTNVRTSDEGPSAFPNACSRAFDPDTLGREPTSLFSSLSLPADPCQPSLDYVDVLSYLTPVERDLYTTIDPALMTTPSATRRRERGCGRVRSDEQPPSNENLSSPERKTKRGRKGNSTRLTADEETHPPHAAVEATEEALPANGTDSGGIDDVLHNIGVILGASSQPSTCLVGGENGVADQKAAARVPSALPPATTADGEQLHPSSSGTTPDRIVLSEPELPESAQPAVSVITGSASDARSSYALPLPPPPPPPHDDANGGPAVAPASEGARSVDWDAARAEIDAGINSKLGQLQAQERTLLSTLYRTSIERHILLAARDTIDKRVRELQRRRMAILRKDGAPP